MPKWIILGSRIFYWNWLTQQLVNTILIISSFELTSSFIKQTLQGHSRKISLVSSRPIFSWLSHHLTVPRTEGLPPSWPLTPFYPVTSPWPQSPDSPLAPLSRVLPSSSQRGCPSSPVFTSVTGLTPRTISRQSHH